MVKKITTATEKQWQRIEEIRQRWIDEQTRDVPFADVLSAVRGLYGFLDKKPIVFQVDGPIHVSVAMQILKFGGQLNGQLDGQLRGQLNGQLYGQLYDQLNDQLRDQLDDQLHGQLDGQLDGQLRGQLDDQLDGQLYGQFYGQLDDQLDGQLRGQLNGQLDDQLRDQLNDQLDDQLRVKLDDQLGDQLDDQLDGQLDGQLRVKLHGQLRGQLNGQLDGQLRGQLNGQLYGQLYDQLNDQLGDQLKKEWVCLWWQSWAAWYEGAALLGVRFDEEKYNLFQSWCKSVPVCRAMENVCIVSKWPSAVRWQNNLLHNESGPSVEFRDGFKTWTIGGIPVDEQIVMRPETQTVQQIDAEQNGDVRSIRIDRFGWPRYLKETGSECKHARKNDVEGTREALYRTPKGEQRLVVTCPTGRMFALGVPNNVDTCESAQAWLGGGKKMNVIGAN